MNEDYHVFPTAVSACLVSTPVWAQILHEYSQMAQTVSVMIGIVIGVVTLYRMLVKKRKPE